jgi:hypothetical protein
MYCSTPGVVNGWNSLDDWCIACECNEQADEQHTEGVVVGLLHDASASDKLRVQASHHTKHGQPIKAAAAAAIEAAAAAAGTLATSNPISNCRSLLLNACPKFSSQDSQ